MEGRGRGYCARTPVFCCVSATLVCPWVLALGDLSKVLPWIATVVVGIILLSAGRSRTPYTRLCALQWNRGDRFGAVMLFFNVTEPRYSAKRIARNKAALEAAQVGMPKECWFNSFAKRDDQ